MRIRYPNCGERSLDEFSFYGDAAPQLARQEASAQRVIARDGAA